MKTSVTKRIAIVATVSFAFFGIQNPAIGVTPKHKYYFYHTNYIVKVPRDFQVLTKIKNKIIVAYNSKKNILGVQFHPEKYKKTLRIILHAWIAKCVTA